MGIVDIVREMIHLQADRSALAGAEMEAASG